MLITAIEILGAWILISIVISLAMAQVLKGRN